MVRLIRMPDAGYLMPDAGFMWIVLVSGIWHPAAR